MNSKCLGGAGLLSLREGDVALYLSLSLCYRDSRRERQTERQGETERPRQMHLLFLSPKGGEEGSSKEAQKDSSY